MSNKNDSYSASSLLEDLSQSTKEKEIDPKEFRYALYARKSTKGKDRQERSIGDQISDCLKLAEEKELKVIGAPIIEKESAKYSGIRPKFTKLLEDINNNKYDGILACHPDRLARNMKEGGEIIDLLDKEVIKDLKFYNFNFMNDKSGKVMLGIQFVFAKHYSDNLSSNVRRGIAKSLAEGKSQGTKKHGYFITSKGLLYPDGNNFSLIKKAWKMRIHDKADYKEIASFLNRFQYERPVGHGQNKYKIHEVNDGMLTTMFHDPFYAGVIQHGEELVDLTSVDGYAFEAITNPEDFKKLNSISKANSIYHKRKKNVMGRLLNGKVICDHCETNMEVSITGKSKGRLFYYRCPSSNCGYKRKGKKVTHHVRAKEIVNSSITLLRDHFEPTQEAYTHFKKDMKNQQKIKTSELRSQLAIINNQIKDIENSLEQRKEYILEEKDLEIKGIFKEEIKDLKKDLKASEKALSNLKLEIEKHKETIPSFKKFTELIKDLPDTIKKTKKLDKLDFYLSKIFSNLYVRDKKVLKVGFNEPFEKLLSEEFRLGQPCGTKLELIFARDQSVNLLV